MINDALIAKENIRVQKIITIIGITLFIIKFAAWAITHSLAIYTDMLESIVNIISAFIGLYSLHFSAQPRDEKHPYGHGKVEFISAALEGTFVILAGGFIIFKVITSFRSPPELHQLDLGIGLIVLTAIVNFAMGAFAIRTGRKHSSLALIASGKHLQTDTWSTLGIIVGLTIVALTGYAWLDSVVAFLFASLIIWSGVDILREAFAGILDASDPKLIANVVDHINNNRRDNWIDLHNLRIIKYGRILHFDAHLTVPGHLTVEEGHREMKILEQLIKDKYGSNIEMFVHLDPYPAGIPVPPRANWSIQDVIRRHGRKS